MPSVQRLREIKAKCESMKNELENAKMKKLKNLVVNRQTTPRHFLKIQLENWSEAQCLVDLAVKHERRDLLEILLSHHPHLHWDQYHVDQALYRNDRETADFLTNRFPNSFDKNSTMESFF